MKLMTEITEYIYLKGFKDFIGEKSIHLTLWPQVQSLDDEILEFGKTFVNLVEDVRKYKTQNGLSMRSEIEKVEINAPQKFEEYFKLTEKDLIACTNALNVVYRLN